MVEEEGGCACVCVWYGWVGEGLKPLRTADVPACSGVDAGRGRDDCAVISALQYREM